MEGHFVKTLLVTIPVIDDISVLQFEEAFVRRSYTKVYLRFFAPPDRIRYFFDGFTDKGAENFEERVRVLCESIFDKEYIKYVAIAVNDEKDFDINNENR